MRDELTGVRAAVALQRAAPVRAALALRGHVAPHCRRGAERHLEQPLHLAALRAEREAAGCRARRATPLVLRVRPEQGRSHAPARAARERHGGRALDPPLGASLVGCRAPRLQRRARGPARRATSSAAWTRPTTCSPARSSPASPREAALPGAARAVGLRGHRPALHARPRRRGGRAALDPARARAGLGPRLPAGRRGRDRRSALQRPARGAGASAMPWSRTSCPSTGRSCARAIRARRSIGHTVWETDRLPAHWPALLDRADLVIVPTELEPRSRETLGRARAGGRRAAHRRHAARRRRATSGARSRARRSSSTRSLRGRPARRSHMPCAPIRSAFSGRDDTLLVIKTSPHDFTDARCRGGQARWRRARRRGRSRACSATCADPAPVRLVTGELDERDIDALHTRGDCYLSLCRSEGWGIPPFDAAAWGNPVVITGFGGQLAYLDPEDAYPRRLRARGRRRSRRRRVVHAATSSWAEPSVEHAAALLQAGTRRAGGGGRARRARPPACPARVRRPRRRRGVRRALRAARI